MPSHGSALSVRLEDGWWVRDADRFQFFSRTPPPRPWGYLHQMKLDSSSWNVLAFWIGGAGGLVAGALGYPFFFLLGVIILLLYVKMLRDVVRGYRHSSVVVATVANLKKPHRVYPELSIADAQTQDGQIHPVVVDRASAERLMGANGSIKVAVLLNPNAECSDVIGIRDPMLGNEEKAP